MSNFWNVYSSNFEFAFVLGIFALSAYIGLWSGVLSLAPIAFAAGAAFTSARIDFDHPGLPLAYHLLIGVSVGSFLALVTSFALLRLGTHYLALATIATVLIAKVIVLNLPQYTGATVGIPITRTITTSQILVILAAVCVVFGTLRKSRFGYALDAVREQPEVASALGINLLKVRRIAFVMSGFFGGLAGVMHGQLSLYLSPDSFYLDLAFIAIASAVLGGAYIWVGPIVGALLYSALPELLRPFLGNNNKIPNGILLILIMLFLQRGLIDPRVFRKLISRRSQS